jgi:hypothetical protein
VRLGVVILPERPWSEAAGIWRDAEGLGFAHAWTYDHLAWGALRDSAWFGAFPVLAAAATVTSHIRVGTMVASPNFRHPVALARDVLAIDDISNGPFELGVGAGGEGWDATMLGQQPWSRAERAARFAEFVELTDQLLTERALSYSGLLPGQRGPLVSGVPPAPAGSIRRRWHPTEGDEGRRPLRPGVGHYRPRDAAQQLPAPEGSRVVADQLVVLSKACREIGRDVSELRRFALAGPVLAQGLSSEQEFADTLGRYEEVGVTDFVVHWPRNDQLSRVRVSTEMRSETSPQRAA